MSELNLKVMESDDRIWLDFIVDGKSLYSVLHPELDYPRATYPQAPGVTCLTLMYQDEELQKALDGLLLRRPADFPDNRRALYVCSICGDLGCGAETAVIEEGEDAMIWRDFGWENTYEDNVDIFQEVGPFVFSKVQYFDALKDSLTYLT